MPPSSALVAIGMVVITLLVAVALVYAYARAHARAPSDGERAPSPRPGLTPVQFAAGVFGWVAIVAGAGASGVLRQYDLRPAPMFIMVVAGIVLAIGAGASGAGARLARGLPLAALVSFEAFRLPLELLMHRAALEGTMPPQMSYSGWNFDILSGVSAILVALLAARGLATRWLVQTWAVLSTLLLGVIVVVAVASTPTFYAFGRAPEHVNTWIGWFPFSWLPGVLVPAALFGQIVIFRRLASERFSASSAPRSTPRRPSRA